MLELTKLDQMTSNDYEMMILLHLCDMADCVNARFVWMRAAEIIKKNACTDLDLAWNIS